MTVAFAVPVGVGAMMVKFVIHHADADTAGCAMGVVFAIGIFMCPIFMCPRC